MIFSPPHEPKGKRPVKFGGINTESPQVVAVQKGAITPLLFLKNSAKVHELLFTVIFTVSN